MSMFIKTKPSGPPTFCYNLTNQLDKFGIEFVIIRQKSMQTQIEQLYRSKLHNIQQKFQVISEAYTKLLLELDRKNEIIDDLNRVIQILEINVEQSNSKLEEAKAEIQALRVKLDKETMIKKVYIATHNKTNNMVSVPTSPKTSSANLGLNSQTSITPKVVRQKESNETDQAMEVKQKYENLLKSLSPISRTSLLGDTTNKLTKINNDNHISSKKELKNFDLGQPTTKFNDVTNKLNKQKDEAKQSQFKLQPRPITHDTAFNEIVNKQSNMQTLTKIWEQRDREIQKMDELFESINSKLKQFQQ